MRPRLALCQFALLVASMPALGAELFYMDHDRFTDHYVGSVGPLVMSGEIVAGDYTRLLSRITADENRFFALNTLILASDGGDVAEALKIAALVKSLYAAVSVGPLTGRCVSACFFIYAAAVQRAVDGERLIGINRPYLVDADAATAEGRALAPVRAFLRENAVPDYLVEEMFRRASDDAYWLSADDQKSMGYRSPSFTRYLKTKCAWDDDVERQVYAGKRPVEDLKDMSRCRDRITRSDGHKALTRAAATPRGPIISSAD